MAVVRLSPKGIISIANLTPTNVAYLQDDPDSPDLNSLIPVNTYANPTVRLKFQTNSGTQITGTQEIRWVMTDNSFIGSHIDIYEGGVIKATSPTVYGNAVQSYTFDASLVDDKTLSNVGFEVVGHLFNSQTIQDIKAVEINANVVEISGPQYVQSPNGNEVVYNPTEPSNATTEVYNGEVQAGEYGPYSATSINMSTLYDFSYADEDPYDMNDTSAMTKNNLTLNGSVKFKFNPLDRLTGIQKIAVRCSTGSFEPDISPDPILYIYDKNDNLVLGSLLPITGSVSTGIFEYEFNADTVFATDQEQYLAYVEVLLNCESEGIRSSWEKIHGIRWYSTEYPSIAPDTIISISNTLTSTLSSISDDPDSRLVAGGNIRYNTVSQNWNIKIGFPTSTYELFGRQAIRFYTMWDGGGGLEPVTGYMSIVLYDDGVELYRERINTTDSVLLENIYFDKSLLSDGYGSNLQVGFEFESLGWKDLSGSTVYSNWSLSGVEWLVNVDGKPMTEVAPDTPIIVSPTNGATSGATTVFNATLNDAEDPSLNDTVSLIVDYSQDQTFSSGVTTVTSSPVSPSSVASVSSEPMVNGTWYWRAKAKDSGILESGYTPTYSLTVSNNPPNVPTNIYPLDGMAISELSPTFSANVSDGDGGTVSMVIDYSTSSSFATFTSIQSEFVASGTTATVLTESPLSDNTTYYWRARSYDGIMYSSYTPTKTLIVNNNPPSVPMGLSPANNTVVSTNSFTISATTSDPENDTVRIDFQVSKTIDFAVIEANSTYNTPFSYTFPASIAGNYYWRVRARDSLNQLSNWTTPRNVYVNTVISGRLAPDAILSQTNLTGTVANITDDPNNSSDSTWLTASSDADTSVRVSFPTPPSNLKTGAGLQQFVVRVRTTTTGATATAIVKIYENGTLKASGTTTNVTYSDSMLLPITFDASILSNISGANVECQVDGTYVRSGGSRAKVEVGGIEWNYQCVPPTQSTAPSDTTPPLGVSNLTATASKTSTTVTWNNPTDSDFSHVEIYRNNVLIKDKYTGNIYTDTGLTPNTQYTYKLIAVDGSGNKSAQNTYTVTTQVDSIPVPTPTIVSISQNVISDEVGKDICTVTFTFDTDVVAWEVRVLGTGHGTGTLADSGGAVASGTQIQAVIDWTELYQEGVNRVNIYGQSSTGWTAYES
jgi:hypothetical protein